ncbi:unnamed protein product [Effrenium voratum]|nr:unnamed protein product [Effrenium voratum]
MVQMAIVDSEGDGKQLARAFESMDLGLGMHKLLRATVPGDGDCMYHSLIASAKEKGHDLGAVLDVRVKVHGALAGCPWWYRDYVVGPYWEMVNGVLVRGTWGDDVQLQAFCDSSGHGVRVYYLTPDPITEEYVLASHVKCPWDNDNPGLVLEVCNIQEWHFDAVVPLDYLDRAPGKAAIPDSERKETGAKKKARKSKPRNLGYDLSARSLPENARKHKYAIDEGDIDPSIKEYFYQTATASKAKGGRKRHVCTDKTAGMHWYTLRQFLGWAKKAGHLEKYAGGKVHPAELLKNKDLLKKYYQHFEDDLTCRGTNFSPGAITLATRGLVVSAQILLAKYTPGGKKKKEKAVSETVELLRDLGHSSAEQMAIRGPGLPKPGEEVGKELPDAAEMVRTFQRHALKRKNLTKKLAKLPEDTPSNQSSYMVARRAKLEAYSLAWQFIMQTTERLGTTHELVLNRNLLWSEAEQRYYYVPVGAHPQKNARAKRLGRHHFVSRKFLSQEWSQSFQAYMADQYPRLMEKLGYGEEGPELPKAPARPGGGERAPWYGIKYDSFRKGIRDVAKTPSTDVRGAAEAHLVQDPNLMGQLHQQRSLQLFVGHQPGVSLKHYHRQDSSQLSKSLAKLLKDGSETDAKKKREK